ncbi:copper transporter 6-like isoform X2 [Andrographis paniculata]|uniref:copper transporter 6-like isoform X2 n=1 Tax=Andrographis paniculata TaxID=175694 RepID=UPI0021E7B18E|nr:copper transporter 6-like isoform X2 [Andrographis paniculata]
MDGHDHMHGGGGGATAAGMAGANGTTHLHHVMMHMTFFWGHNTEILFAGFPGYGRAGIYVLALAMVFVVAAAVEWLSATDLLRGLSDHWAAPLLRTALHVVRTGLAYLVMLALMSFNGGVFMAAVAGHGAGFFLFGRKRFDRPATTTTGDSGKLDDARGGRGGNGELKLFGYD